MAKRNSTATKKAVNTPDVEAEGNVDKIRDILFGGQMRDYDHRFAQLEEVIAEHNRRLTEEMQRRFSKLDEFVRKEFDALGEKLSKERKERTADRDDGRRSLEDFKRTVDGLLSGLEEKTDAEARALRGSLHDQEAELGELVQRTREQLETSLSRETNALQDRKVSRDDLAGLFTEVALRLNREFDLPEE